MKWQTAYQGKPLLLNILVQNQFLALHKELQQWACREQWRQWREATKFRQAKQLLRQVDLSFTKYAL